MSEKRAKRLGVVLQQVSWHQTGKTADPWPSHPQSHVGEPATQQVNKRGTAVKKGKKKESFFILGLRESARPGPESCDTRGRSALRG